MALANENYLKLKAGYRFPEIGRRVRAFAKAASLLLAAIAVKLIRSGIVELAGP